MKKSYLAAGPFLLLMLLTGTSGSRGAMSGASLLEAVPPGPAPDTAAAPAAAAPEAAAPVDTALVRARVEEALRHPRKAKPLPPAVIDEETLWLARCIFSETKRPEEQELVAWIVRNRVETAYRRKRSYRDVVLDPYQFSAFNPGSPVRGYYLRLGVQARVPGWRRALTLAHAVRHAPPGLRPVPRKTRHFYSERSMVGSAHPNWAVGLRPVTPERPHRLDARRFRFYAGVF